MVDSVADLVEKGVAHPLNLAGGEIGAGLRREAAEQRLVHHQVAANERTVDDLWQDPKLMGWINLQLALHSHAAKPVGSAGFKRLPEYFSANVLQGSRFVLVDRVPMPPLSRLGLPQFGEFEQMSAAGITYQQTFFVHRDYAGQESLFFHELIHVLQWSQLGPQAFVWRYAKGLEAAGYRECPLEVMAYDAQHRFETDSEPFDAARYVEAKLAET